MLKQRWKDVDRREEILREFVFALWNSRKEMIFTSSQANPIQALRYGEDSKDVQETAKSWVFAGQLVRWKRPDFGSIKFNCDGAWNATIMHAGVGWVARDFSWDLQVAGGTGTLIDVLKLYCSGGCCSRSCA
ncbi:hypothetical protein D8674_035100 [Pyrus ussuriensis x Pyrus communis]|uniref:Uncharacterized protein n=1 Tax=Pyrus ussuriensis x Pyrus communis TaxID=2448454 RepID=A0A5N5GPV1_9ROSA|nr:hypothetical protein D8674_035100 [Pyrus ussuriensis x Pyrus communis]